MLALRERPELEDAEGCHPLFVNRAGGRQSARSIAKLVEQVGVDAGSRGSRRMCCAIRA